MGPTDHRCFEDLFDRHSAAVLTYLVRRSTRVIAEDALSETFLVAWRRLDEVPDNALPWLYGVARHALANQVRAEARRAALVQRVADHQSRDTPGVGEDTPWISAAMEQLSAADREVLRLDAWEELSPREAAQVLGCLPATYTVRLHRARARLRRLMEDPSPTTTSIARPSTSESHT